MSVFAQIEAQLVQFAAEQPACLTRDRGGESLRSWGPNEAGFEERRIDWHRDGFNLAVIIQPTFTAKGVDSTKWNFYTVAWQDGASGRLVAGQDIAREVSFEQLEAHIEQWLAQARAYLDRLRVDDLKPPVEAWRERKVRRQKEAGS